MHYFQTEPNVFCLDKPVGWTPLQALEELRKREQVSTDTPLTYAGRLDPMAEGLLLVLAGSRVHEKNAFLKLDKQYSVTALVGVETDSYDLLGLPILTQGQLDAKTDNTERTLSHTLQSFVGPLTLRLPDFSSPPQQGKPLFWWKRNKPDELEPTVRTTRIHAITNVQTDTISAADLSAYVHKIIPQVHGDFRQTDIVAKWESILRDQQFTTVTCTVNCESGTYIRSLIHELGKRLGTGACVYTLRRTSVGPYTL